MGAEGHEQIVMCSDPAVGLQAIIAIHDTTLGPACGGVRIWPYESEQEAVMDALRLSRAMTYKSAAADLPLGGGKGVIIADAHTQKTEALLRSYGRFVDTLAGRYLTTTDVGSTGRDLEYVGQETARGGRQADHLGRERGYIGYDRPWSLYGHEGLRQTDLTFGFTDRQKSRHPRVRQSRLPTSPPSFERRRQSRGHGYLFQLAGPSEGHGGRGGEAG